MRTIHSYAHLGARARVRATNTFSQNARLSFCHHRHRRRRRCRNHHYFILCWIYRMHLEQQSIYMTANILSLKINNLDTRAESWLGANMLCQCWQTTNKQTNTHTNIYLKCACTSMTFLFTTPYFHFAIESKAKRSEYG